MAEPFFFKRRQHVIHSIFFGKIMPGSTHHKDGKKIMAGFSGQKNPFFSLF